MPVTPEPGTVNRQELLRETIRPATEALRGSWRDIGRVAAEAAPVLAETGRVLAGVRVPDGDDPRSWGLTFDGVAGGRGDEPTMADLTRLERLYGDDLEAAQRLFDRGLMPAEDVRAFLAFGADEVAQHARLSRSLGLSRRRYEDRERLMRETRAEFPDDPYSYGRISPPGPMRWTPPADGVEVRSCP